MRTLAVSFTFVAALLGASRVTHAAVIITVSEMASDVVFSYSGSLDIAGLVPTTHLVNGVGFFHGKVGTEAAIGFGVGPQMQGYEGAPSFPAMSASFTRTILGVTTGTGFSLFAGDLLGLPIGYVSKAPLAGTLTLPDETFDTLRLIAGVYRSDLPSGDYIELTIDHSGVPEPSVLLLFGAGGGALGVRAHRRSRRV